VTVLAAGILLAGASPTLEDRRFEPQDAGPKDQRSPDTVNDLFKISLDRMKKRPRPLPARNSQKNEEDRGKTMTHAKQGDTVVVNYIGRRVDGPILVSSYHGQPLQFTLGRGEVIHGLEQAVHGMEPGQTRATTLEAFGSRRDDLVFKAPRDSLPDSVIPEVGGRLEVQREPDHILPVTVTHVSDTEVTVDANHPLAGEEVTFEIRLEEIR
jgi:peptidylprolyl isomerase